MSRVPFLTIALSASTMATVLPAAAALHSTRTAFFFAQPLFELKALLPNLRTRHQTCNFSPSLSLRRFSSLRQRNLSPMAMSDAAPTAEATGTPLPSQNILQRGPTVVSERKETPFQRFDTLSTALGGSGKAKMVWKSLREGKDPWTNEEEVTPHARQTLLTNFEPLPLVSMGSKASCGTTKMLVRLADGLEVEAVVIPHEGRPTAQSVVEPRTTLCVSSQVGCNRGCAFCATGKMGFVRNLSVHEILSQVFLAHRCIKEKGLPPLHNVVFMGMGEPLNNVHSVAEAVRILTDDNCFRISPSKVTVSSVGPSPELIRATADVRAMLAWSVHAADDSLRKQLVPTTKHSMTLLRDTYLDVLKARTRGMSVFMVAVTLINGVNDSEEHAEQLVQLMQPLRDAGIKLCVDLIPYNDIGAAGTFGLAGGVQFTRTQPDRVNAFQKVVRSYGLTCFVRVTRGDDEGAACGQLVTTAGKLRRKRQAAQGGEAAQE
mmetsp:Transcript_55456/g.129794  ORF Transcript_55456/g.129794 Transcript_55456/m.129794 type:complete len:489 (-) Transcript_55456:231-1697(-)